MHNEKVWIINIQLHGMKQIRHLPRWRIPPIDQILAFAPNQNLPRHINFLALLVPNRTGGLVLIIEHDGDAGLVDAGLALFIDEVGQIAGADL